MSLGIIRHIVFDIVCASMKKYNVRSRVDACQAHFRDVVDTLASVTFKPILRKVARLETSNELDLVASDDQALVK